MSEKTGYHHGDLATALVEAGLALTRAGGPDALTIRAATRQAGVSPNAAYRHFADREALLAAVGDAVETRMALRMAAELPAEPAGRSLLAAVGLGYIRFALAEPGWFSVAFFAAGSDVSESPPFLALVAALDASVAEGSLAPESRDGAEWPCWSAVHGFAELALRGPLRGTSAERLDLLAVRTVEDIISGVCGAPGRD